jgi:hypothetical protein
MYFIQLKVKVPVYNQPTESLEVDEVSDSTEAAVFEQSC